MLDHLGVNVPDLGTAKAYYDVIGQVNSADAIVPTDWERIAFWEGERCEVRLALSARPPPCPPPPPA